MLETCDYTSVLQKKIMLSVFLFALVLSAGRIVYSGFEGLAYCFAPLEHDAAPAPSFLPSRTILAEADSRAQVGRNTESDMALSLYRSEDLRDDVIAFYSELAGSRDISAVILKHADENNISPSLAFALSWEESRFRTGAVNKNSDSVDRGLFQLNSRSFPSLSADEMFNPEINAKTGLSHLRFCIDLGGNEVAALAMYNAGSVAVRNGNTPKQTLDYVSRILAYRDATDMGLMQFIGEKSF